LFSICDADRATTDAMFGTQ